MYLRQLLVIIDPTHEGPQRSLERATWVATRTRSAVELLICEYNSALDGGFFFDGPAQQKARASLLSNRKKWLEKLAQPLREQGIEVTTEARWGKPLHTMIIERAKELKPDMVFRDGYNHTFLERLFFNNTSWQLIRQCPAPLWLVGENEWHGQRMSAALDPVHAADKPATLDHRLIKATRYLAERLNMQADYLHSYAPLPRTMVFDTELVAAYDEYLARSEKQHTEAFESLLTQYPIEDQHKHLLAGFPEQTIPDFVNEHAVDVLVMGAISRSNIENALIGNTAERILEASSCDLLIIKPSDDFGH